MNYARHRGTDTKNTVRSHLDKVPGAVCLLNDSKHNGGFQGLREAEKGNYCLINIDKNLIGVYSGNGSKAL